MLESCGSLDLYNTVDDAIRDCCGQLVVFCSPLPQRQVVTEPWHGGTGACATRHQPRYATTCQHVHLSSIQYCKKPVFGVILR